MRKRRVDLYPLIAIGVIIALTVLLFGPDYVFGKIKEAHETAEEVVSELPGIAPDENAPNGFDLDMVPEYSGEPFVIIHDNVPFFSESDITVEPFEYYGELDALGRCTVAFGCYGLETVPAPGEERGDISSVHPSGYKQKFYDCVDDGDPDTTGASPYENRCHLIAWCISAENANERNLVTGTRYMNVDGMWYAEEQVQNYIYESNGGHVLYRVTPIFRGANLVCDGVLMEAYSVEDGGALQFCLFCYNVQPGITIDYRTGESTYSGVFLDMDATSVIYP